MVISEGTTQIKLKAENSLKGSVYRERRKGLVLFFAFYFANYRNKTNYKLQCDAPYRSHPTTDFFTSVLS